MYRKKKKKSRRSSEEKKKLCRLIELCSRRIFQEDVTRIYI